MIAKPGRFGDDECGDLFCIESHWMVLLSNDAQPHFAGELQGFCEGTIYRKTLQHRLIYRIFPPCYRTRLGGFEILRKLNMMEES